MNAEDFIAERLGPTPVSMLEQIIRDYPDMAAATIVVELADGRIIAASGGCTMIETIGLLHYAAAGAAKVISGDA